MTAAELDQRLIKSRKVLHQWMYEAALSWADRPMIRGIAETEIGILRELMDATPAAQQPQIAQLVDKWDKLRLSLLDA